MLARQSRARECDVPVPCDLTVNVDEVVIRQFQTPAPDAMHIFSAVKCAVSTQTVTGFLVGVRDGPHWGWWGPIISEDVIDGLRKLTQRTNRRLRGTPEHCAGELRRATRHAHTGVYSVSVGAFELACWDLLGHRHCVPVWQLVTERPTREHVPSYATCFGLSLAQPGAAEVVAHIAEVWPVQKWRPVTELQHDGSPSVCAGRAAGPHGLALDFGGHWSARAALGFASAVPLQLAFIEEPTAPDALTDLTGIARPAPIAAGEHCYHPGETAILSGAEIDIWQPDAVFCGGFAALRTIAATAAAARRLVYPHGGGLIPAVHAAIAGSPVDFLEFHLLLESRRQTHLRRPLLADAHGEFRVPDQPGWAGSLRSNLDET